MTVRGVLFLCSLFVISVRTSTSAGAGASHRSSLEGSASSRGEQQIPVTQSSGLGFLSSQTGEGSSKSGTTPAKSAQVSVAQNEIWFPRDDDEEHVDVKRDITEMKNLKGADGVSEEALYDIDDISDGDNDAFDIYSEGDLMSRNDKELNLFDVVPSFPATSKRGGPYWAARGKKGIRDYIPFYWGSNQNMWGKTAFSPSALPDPILSSSDPVETQRSGTLSSLTKTSGWESNQNFWGKRDNGPFWISRGKKAKNKEDPWSEMRLLHRFWGPNPWHLGKRSSSEGLELQNFQAGPPDSEGEGPFWLSRGKRKKMTDEEFPSWAIEELRRNHPKNFWIPRGKKEEDEGMRPFWVSRGKKKDDRLVISTESNEDTINPFWVARGKKEQNPFWLARGKKKEGKVIVDDAKDSKPFWIARGKKFDDQRPFWVSRGKKEERVENPFWVARGKKEHENNPFWVTRGKKFKDDKLFWAVRGKKTGVDNPYWISRGKKEKIVENPFWVSRGKKENTSNLFRKKDTLDNPFWVTRGKRPKHAQKEDLEEGGPFWVVRGRRDYDPTQQQQDPEQLAQFLLNALTKDHQEPITKRNLIQSPTLDGSVSKDISMAIMG